MVVILTIVSMLLIFSVILFIFNNFSLKNEIDKLKNKIIELKKKIPN